MKIDSGSQSELEAISKADVDGEGFLNLRLTLTHPLSFSTTTDIYTSVLLQLISI